MSGWPLFSVSVALAFGMMAGIGHFGMLRIAVDRFVTGRLPAALGLQAARVLVLGLVLASAARFGAPSLMACAAGVLAGRWVILHRAIAA